MRRGNLISIIYFLFFINSFSYVINDYELFNKAEELYNEGDYLTASLKFRSLKDTFPSSVIVKSNYYAYFMALNYYKLGDLDKAIFYMQKAIYTPKYLHGKNYFDLDRNFYLSKFYYEKKDMTNSFYYLKRLVNIDYSPSAKDYENYAFQILKDSSENLNILYQIKYKNDFSKINSSSTEDLLIASKYFIDRGEFPQAAKVLEAIYKKQPKNEKVISQYLYTLYSLKNYDKILKITENMLDSPNSPLVFYFRGKAFINIGEFPDGIVNLKKFVHLEKNTQLPFVADARESIFDLYLSLNNYREIVSFSEEIKPVFIKEKASVILSNIKLKNYSLSLALINEFIKEYPGSLQSYYFSYLLKKLDYAIDENSESILEEFFKLSSFKSIGDVISFYLGSLSNYNLDLEKEFSNPKVKILFDIASLEDSNLLNLELENTLFISNIPIVNSFLVTKIFEKSKNYNLAYKNSIKNRTEFSKYKNFLSLLYPKYYIEEVAEASKKYDVPEDIIYSAILVGSGFDSEYAGSMYRVGLMQVSYNPVIVKDFSILKNPKSNIDTGVERLSLSIKKNKSGIKGLIEYLYGADILNSIYFENNELYLNKISDPVIKQKIATLLETLLFYKIIYY